MAERRKYRRHSFSCPPIAAVSAALRIRVLDIGLGGALLLSDVPVAIGTRCLLSFPGNGFTITADVEVRHVTPNSDVPDYAVGVSFIALRPDDAAYLRQFVTGTREMR